MKVRNLAKTGILTALALIAFLLEGLVPPPVPAVPWAKLGISNVFLLLTLFLAGIPYAILALVCKCLIAGMVSGFLTVWYSLSAGAVSLAAGILLYRFAGRIFSLTAISGVCAAIHNAVQILMAILLTGTPQLAYYLPVSAAIGLVTGGIVGVLVWICLRALRKLSRFR